MWWLWIAGPLSLVVIYVLTGWPDKRRLNELERWRRSMGPKTIVRKEKAGYRSGKEIVERREGTGAKRLGALPGPMKRMVDAAGGGDLLGHFELAPRLAYLSVTGATSTSGSDLQSITAKLEDAGPSFTARPLPIVEGERVPNTGIQFKKDPDFMAFFLVEPAVPETTAPTKQATAAKTPSETALSKEIRAWLSRPIREALLDFPDAWLSVQGKTMALTLYGAVSAEKLDELVNTADIIFAEHGAEGGPSLLGESFDESEGFEEDEEIDEEPAAKPAPAKAAAAARPAPAKASVAAKPAPAKASAAKPAPAGPVKGTPNKRI
ncbi:MAG: hypothetical protein ABI193_23170 [Minicystis sp.]